MQRLVNFQARIFQHELDHLDGTLYLDRMPEGSKGLSTLLRYTQGEAAAEDAS